MLDEEQEAELRNPFPSPPSHYQKYTSHNLHLLSLLKERTATKSEEERAQLDQREILSDQKNAPDWPLMQLEKPRVDWILEEGHYTVFGDTWFVSDRSLSCRSQLSCVLQVKEKIPSLGELGGQQLYPDDPTVGKKSILRHLMFA